MASSSSYRPLFQIPFFFFSIFHSSLITTTAGSNSVLNVLHFGAKSDAKSDSTNAFLAAWTKTCASSSPSQIYVPQGRYLISSPLVFNGQNCKSSSTTFLMGGSTLVAHSDYRYLKGALNWIMFEHVTGVSVIGGTVDGQGAGLWACKASGKTCPFGATQFEFSDSKNILINGLTSLNSQLFHIVINGCQNVKIQQIKVVAGGNSPNTDGIHVQMSTGVAILDSSIKTGDDCVSIGEGTTNLWIEKMTCGPGHGISIGSLGKDEIEAGVQNVTVKSVTFSGTQNGLRIKSWGRASTSFVKHVLFQHATMINAQNPIIIDQDYCPDNKNCPDKVSLVKISDVTYDDIHGTSASEVGVKLDCSSETPCSTIKMEGIKLTYNNKPVESSCIHAEGTASNSIQKCLA